MTKEEHIKRADEGLEAADIYVMSGGKDSERLASVVALAQAHISLAQVMQQELLQPGGQTATGNDYSKLGDHYNPDDDYTIDTPGGQPMTETQPRSDIKVEYIQHMGNDEIIAKAARVSTGKDQEENDKIKGLINYLARERHTSPFEHTALTVRIEAPIFVAREAMRHRTFSFNEISGRYAKLAPEVYVPGSARPLINMGSGAHPHLVQAKDSDTYFALVSGMLEAYDKSWEIYEYFLAGNPEVDDVVATEVARSILPVGTYTSWYMTGNLHAWFNFLRLRDGEVGHPQYEIVELAQQVWPIIEEHWPIAAKAWKEKDNG